ncbi:hypothetical protein, partial [Mesorhizobium sp.]|uniref:hypothetical protein n=1 Tax=Mesorhizobium sp. TaxID=1871066 RepID=UPI002601322B
MVRPITLKPSNPPNPPQKVTSKTNADRTSRLQNEAARLQEQIRLANKMGERDWAAQARQRLSQVKSELSSLQTPPTTTPVAPRVNGTTGSPSGNGTTTPALFTMPTTFSATNGTRLVMLDGATGQNPQATASGIVKDITEGKSIDNIAADRRMTREDVLAALKAGGMTVATTDPTSDNGDVRTTRITD